MTAALAPPPAGAREAVNLHAALVEGLRDLIIRGELGGGRKVSEADLCRRFSVSRTPLREALKALAVEGLIDLRPNRGAVVVPLDAAHIAAVFEAKGALERFIGLHAAERATDAEVAALEELHRGLEAASARGDVATFTALNERIHQDLARAARNPVVEHLYAGLQAKVLRARYLLNADPDRMAGSLEEHASFMAALGVRARLDLAERLVAHNRVTGESILRQLTETPDRGGAPNRAQRLRHADDRKA